MHPLVERAWKTVPKPLQDAIASGVDRARGATPPPAPIPDVTKKYRLLVGPVNYAGQGYRWSRALEASGEVSARNFVHVENNILQYDADYLVTWRTAEHSRAWQRSMVEVLSRDYTHVLIEACYPVLGGMYSGDLRKQVALMQSMGLKVGIVGHGTDVRLPSAHMASNPWSYFHNDVWVPAGRLEPIVAANLEFIREMDVPTFVSTAGLLSDVPNAHFIGVIVDPDRWANNSAPLVRERIKVVHAPTNPNLKGTLDIAPIARRLHDEGIIEYVEITGIPNDRMPAVFADADVVLDQFRTGDYGVGACETMASGRLVLAHITDQVRNEVERRAGMPLPIPETTIDTVEDVLRDIAERRDDYRRIAATGPEFVRRLHNGDFSRSVLMTYFMDS
jgi:hypothetical protein